MDARLNGFPFPLALLDKEHKRDISSLEPCALLFKSLIHLHILYNVVEQIAYKYYFCTIEYCSFPINNIHSYTKSTSSPLPFLGLYSFYIKFIENNNKLLYTFNKHSTHPKIMLKTQCSFPCHCVFLYTKKPRSIRPRFELK